MLCEIDNIAGVGLVKDVKDHLLPVNAWTIAQNVRFADSKISKFTGHVVVFDPPSIVPYWLLHAFTPASESVWLYAGLTKVYAVSGGTHANITRQTAAVDVNYSTPADGLWTGGVLGGIPVINNSVDVPQSWSPVGLSQRLVDLPNWNANWRAKTVRAWKNFLIALNLTESGTNYPHKLRWSHPAAPGAVPTSWDDTDKTKDAGFAELSDTFAGALLDCAPLRDVNILYKERSFKGMQFIGGQSKMRIYDISNSSGILHDHCVTVFSEPEHHFVMTGEDIITHDGQNIESRIEARLKRWLRANISTSKYARSFCTTNLAEKECWFCFPVEGSDWPNMAVVWNWTSGQVSLRDLPQTSFIAPGAVSLDTSGTWDSDSGAWDSDADPWNTLSFLPAVRRLVGAVPSATKLHHFDTTEQFNGTNMLSMLERTGYSIIGKDRYGRLMQDRDRWKIVRSIYLTASGAPLQVSVGVQAEPNGAYMWESAKIFTPGVDRKVDFGVSGLNFGLRISSAENQTWEISKIAVDVEPLGQF